jgi:cell division protease FtsH
VSQWGLSDTIGPVLVGDVEQEVFLGRELQSRRVVSERTAQRVDDEVSRVINTAYSRAKDVLTENRALLDTIATSLLERETLTREDFVVLMRGDQLPPRATPPVALPGASLPAPPSTEPKRASPPLLGGPEPSPA